MRGNHWLAQRTASGLRRAITAYTDAIEVDPTYAAAYSGLSTAYALSVTYRYDIGVEAYQAAGLSLASADRAIELDSLFAGGYAARGYIGILTQAPLQGTEADFDRAGRLQPNNASILSWSARVLARKGDIPGALRAARRAVRLDPAHSGRRIAVAYHALRAGEYEVAVDQAREALVYQEEELMLARAIEGRALLLAGRSRECLTIPLGPHAVIRAMCLSDLGREEEAGRIVDSVAVAVQADGESDLQFTDVTRTEDLASYFAWIGSVDQAVVWLTRAYSMSPTGVEVFLLESKLFAPVRDDPTFDLAVDGVRSQVWRRVQDARSEIVLPGTIQR